tara:strand:- start:12055 stop:13989 length:1935 start_codon:yes stop_codon:yes gene_type:complete
MNKEQAINHFKNYGIKEKRKFNELLENFDYTFYVTKYKDLSKMNYLEACNHYIKHGINEKRKFNKLIKSYHNGRVAWGLDTSYAGYPFIAKYIDCKLLVYNKRLYYWDNKCPNLLNYIEHKTLILDELLNSKHLFLFGAMGIKYLIPILSIINKSLKDYNITFFLTDHWYIRDKKLNNNTIYNELKKVENLKILVMPDMVPYIKNVFNYKIYYQCIPFNNYNNINKLNELTVAHSPGLKKNVDHKGTSIIEKVCNKLKIKLIIISGVSWEESVNIKKNCHIFIDQFITKKTREELQIDYYGGIGKSGLEAMKCESLTITSGYNGSMLGTIEHPSPPVDIVKSEDELYKLLLFYKNNPDIIKINAKEQKKYADKYTSFNFVLNNVDPNIKKIKQIKISKNVSFFSDKIKEKYKLNDYTNIYEPVLFFGLYNINDYNAIYNHKGPIVILWTGTDSLYINEKIELKKHATRISKIGRHIAISESVQKRLKNVGIYSEFIPITPTKIIKNTHPKGDFVYFYGKGSKYGEELIPEIEKRISYKIIKTKPNSFSSEELEKIYKKCFIGLRLTPEDGLSNTVIELGLMGRKVIYNCNSLPNSIKYSNIDDIVKLINDEYKKKDNNNDIELIANNMVNYFNKYDDYFLYVST